MLASLHVENIAVIKQVDIDFSSGLSVLTGETGAGKSILIDALGLILGARPSKDLIRNGESRASVSAMFTMLSPEQRERLAALDVIPDEDGCLYLTRSIDREGKAQTKQNGKTVPLSLQKEIVSWLINIHGQNDNRILMSTAAQQAYLDSYAKNGALLDAYRQVYDQMEACRASIRSLSRDEREKARLVELLRYQIADIDAAKLKPGEEEALEARKEKVKNAEKIVKQTRLITKALYRNEKALPAYELVKKAVTALSSVAEYVPGADDYIQRLTTLSYDLEEIGLAVEDLSESEFEDPDTELDRIETRLDLIVKLKRKYGSDVDEILAYRDRSAAELNDMEKSDELLETYKAEYAKYRKEASALAADLTRSRQEAAKALENGVVDELSYLEMPKVRFRVEIRRLSDEEGRQKLNRSGGDDVEFLLSANPGEPLKSLAKIASGGELSRIMLALKSVNAADSAGETLIFDEIDTGVSGKTSQKIGMRLRRLGQHNQILCVTHSAQIASEAHAQYLIRKGERDGRVETSVIPLDHEGRIREIARIMGGVNITDTLLRSAKEMLDSAHNDSNDLS